MNVPSLAGNLKKPQIVLFDPGNGMSSVSAIFFIFVMCMRTVIDIRVTDIFI